LPHDDSLSRLLWKKLPGTEGRYDVALSRKFGGLYDPSKSLLEQVDVIGKDAFLSLHLRQNFWINNPKILAGVAVICHYQVHSADDHLIKGSAGPCPLSYNETKKDSWRVWYAPIYFHTFGIDMLS